MQFSYQQIFTRSLPATQFDGNLTCFLRTLVFPQTGSDLVMSDSVISAFKLFSMYSVTHVKNNTSDRPDSI